MPVEFRDRGVGAARNRRLLLPADDSNAYPHAGGFVTTFARGELGTRAGLDRRGPRRSGRTYLADGRPFGGRPGVAAIGRLRPEAELPGA